MRYTAVSGWHLMSFNLGGSRYYAYLPLTEKFWRYDSAVKWLEYARPILSEGDYMIETITRFGDIIHRDTYRNEGGSTNE